MKKKLKKLVPDKIIETLIESKRALNLLSKKEKSVKLFSEKLNLKRIGHKDFHTFFGYYDISPFNTETGEIVYTRLRRSNLHDAEIVVHDLNGDNLRTIAGTKAWNWQQGSRLRWFPNSADRIILNDLKDGNYISRIVNVRNNDEVILEQPIYDIGPDGRFAISLNFERLGKMRPGYGYPQISGNDTGNFTEEGITLLDVNNNSSKLIVTYENIAEALKVNNKDYNTSYINHLSFSPCGNLFLFFWIEKKNEIHKASLLVYDMRSKEVVPLETKNKVSHYVWLDSTTILCTVYDENSRCNYYKYEIGKDKKLVNPKSLGTDGHPSVIENGKILTDTYPDKDGFQRLLISNIEEDITTTLLKIYSRYKANPVERTDLHPRLNPEMNRICFDANVSGFRQIFILSNESTSYSNYSL